ncbi:MAG: hypothetical protein QY311_01935 [Candidatus Paceibacterota bacterium]|nr:MAG: hypothetical protein QY311_01935 [Candidatus Paceibacterota bacterium]
MTMMRLRRIGLIAMVAMMLALVAAPVARAQSPLDALGPAGLQDVLASVRYCAGVSKDYQVAENDLCVLNAERVPTRVFKGQEPRKRLTPEQIQKAAAVRKARAEAAKAEADRLLQEKIDAAVAAKVEPLQRRVAQLEAEARAAVQRELTANALTRQALEQNRALAEDRDEKLARPMWFVVGILSIMLGMAVALVFMRGSGRRGGDDPPQGPRGPDGGERKLTHEGLRADEVRKPTTEELPIFSVPPSGEPELPKEEVAPTKSEQLEPSTIRDLSPEELAAIAALEPQVPEEGAGGETVALTMATGPILQAEKLEERAADEVALRTSGSLAAESLWRSSPAGPSLLPHADRQPIYEEIYDLFVKAEARKDAGTSSELKQLLADASSASSREDIASVEARLVAARERVNKEWLRDVNA